MSDCVFCKIIKGDIPGAIVFSDEQLTAFRDINPAAPVADRTGIGARAVGPDLEHALAID